MRPAAGIACEILLYPLYFLCCCCCCCWKLCSSHRHHGCVIRNPGWFDIHLKSTPTPLPTRRLRTLTLPLPPRSLDVFSTVSKTRDQDQSLLFARLPLEIRMQIYKIALSGDGFPIHLIRRVPDFISHVRCDKMDGTCYRYRCFEPYRIVPGENRLIVHSTDGALLPLLLSCRQM